MEIEELRTLVAELDDYAQLCNDEFGEYLDYLNNMSTRTFCMSDKFKEAYYVEMKRMLAVMKNMATIETRTVTPEPYEVRELVWHDE